LNLTLNQRTQLTFYHTASEAGIRTQSLSFILKIRRQPKHIARLVTLRSALIQKFKVLRAETTLSPAALATVQLLPPHFQILSQHPRYYLRSSFCGLIQLHICMKASFASPETALANFSEGARFPKFPTWELNGNKSIMLVQRLAMFFSTSRSTTAPRAT